MKFQDSMTSRIKTIANTAEKIWGDWDILWEVSFENINSESVQFLAVKDDKYCLGSLNVELKNNFFFFGGEQNEVSKEDLKKQSKFFNDLGELIQYGKSIKRKYDLEQKIHEPKKRLLIAIKKEVDSKKDEIEFKVKHHNRLSRVD